MSRTKIPSRGEIDHIVFCDSPISIVATEHFREVAGLRCQPGHDIPVDKFVFGKGEGATRHCTKIGGLPYRPADLPWPEDREGAPMIFLAQYCFTGSADHVGTLPGDIMLVFARTMLEPIFGEYPLIIVEPYYGDDVLRFEWYKLGERDVASAATLPKPTVEIPNLYGVRFRSCDYLDEQSAEDAIKRIIPSRRWPKNEFRRAATLRALHCYSGMKIGGKPFWYEPPKEPINGRFIGNLSDVCTIWEGPYPWTNQVEALSFDDRGREDNQLLIRDGFCLNFFLQDDGSVEFSANILY